VVEEEGISRPAADARLASVGKLRLLLVEDTPADAQLVQDYLSRVKRRSFEITTVGQLADAFDALSAQLFDAVLLDLGLPDSSGLNALAEVRGRAGRTPIIVLTGIDDEGLAVEAVRRGAQDYLVKGQFDGNLLARALSYAIERSASEVELHRYRERLEDLVAERTSKLSAANQRLRQEIEERERTESTLRSYQERLRSMAAELGLIEERERRVLAAALHDTVGQALAMAKIRLDAARQEAAAAGLESICAEVHGLLEQAIRDTRSLALDLSPPILYELGFEAAVEWLAERLEQRHGVPCTVKNDGQDKPMSDDVRVVLFQVVRELLVNVVKHARAGRAEVSLEVRGEGIRVEVVDDGVGFDASPDEHKPDESGGFGLFSCAERLDHVGGSLELHSAAGRGTRAVIQAQLAQERAKEKP